MLHDLRRESTLLWQSVDEGAAQHAAVMAEEEAASRRRASVPSLGRQLSPLTPGTDGRAGAFSPRSPSDGQSGRYSSGSGAAQSYGASLAHM